MNSPFFSPDPDTADSLIDQLGSPDITLSDVAEMNNVSIEALTLWMIRPDIARRLNNIESAILRRTRLIATNFLPAAAKVLHSILINHESQEHTLPEPSHTARDVARKAASLLHRLSRPAPLSSAVSPTSKSINPPKSPPAPPPTSASSPSASPDLDASMPPASCPPLPSPLPAPASKKQNGPSPQEGPRTNRRTLHPPISASPADPGSASAAPDPSSAPGAAAEARPPPSSSGS